MLQGQAVAISRTTGIYALLFSGPSRREGGRGDIGVARIERSRTRWQKHGEECGDDGKRSLAKFHGSASSVEKHGEFGVRERGGPCSYSRSRIAPQS